MESLTFHQCVKGAWRDSLRCLHRQPVLALSFLLYAWLGQWVEAALQPDRSLPLRLITYVPLTVFELVKFALFSVVTIQAVRFVLLESRAATQEPLFGRNYWRYLGITFGLALVVLVILAVAIILGCGVGSSLAVFATLAVSHHGDFMLVLVPLVVGVSVLIAVCISGFVLGRLSLLGTHAAIGGAVRVRDAWVDTHGHYWSITLTQLGAQAPVLAVSLTLGVLEAASRRHGFGALSKLGAALASIGTLYVTAACSAWLYRRYANALRGGPPSSHLR